MHYLIGYLSSSIKSIGFVANLDQTSSCNTVPVESYLCDNSFITLTTTVKTYTRTVTSINYSMTKFISLDVAKTL